MNQQTTNRSFDALTRGLASGSISRGKALKLMGAALVGGTLASVGIGEASADELCKPEGKKCRKDKQCCSGDCEGGKCAAACTSDGGSCGSNGQCCSGRCASGACAEACPSDRVLLSNGTCVLPCTNGCPACAGTGFAFCAREIESGTQFCSGGIGDSCATTNDCPTGEVCVSGGTPGRCLVAC